LLFEKQFRYEIALIDKSPTGMNWNEVEIREANISLWLFHLASKKQIIYR
jgi:hypothetical protein